MNVWKIVFPARFPIHANDNTIESAQYGHTLHPPLLFVYRLSHKRETDKSGEIKRIGPGLGGRSAMGTVHIYSSATLQMKNRPHIYMNAKGPAPRVTA